MLIAHHPLLYKPIRRLEAGSPEGDALIYAIENQISIISAHTNWDALGVAEALAKVLGIRRTGFLEARSPELLKLVVFAPEGSEGRILDAVHLAGAGDMGPYGRCSFRSRGTGSFLPKEGSRPAIGEPGRQEEVGESRIEVILGSHLKDRAARAVVESHPYETPAFEFYKADSPGGFGFGLVGEWDPPADPLPHVAGRLGLKVLRHTRLMPERVSRVALMPGSGGSYILPAKRAGAELLITGDLGHHDAQLAQDVSLGVIGAGHFETENPSLALLKEKLEAKAPGLRLSLIPGQSPLAAWTESQLPKRP